MSINIRSAALLVGKIALSLALVTAVFRKVDFAKALASLAAANRIYVTICLLTALPTIMISALRWKILAQGILSFRLALKYILIGMFYGSVLPSGVSGDIARGMALAAKEKPMRLAVLPASILVDRLIGLAALCLLSMVGFVLIGVSPSPAFIELKSMILAGAALSVALFTVAMFPLSPWFQPVLNRVLPYIPHATLRAGIRRVASAIAPYATMPDVLARAFGLGIFVHILTMVGYIFAFGALSISVDFLTAAIFFFCLSIILILPISVSGLGVREVFSIFFFKILDASAEQAVAFSWLLLFLGIVVALVGAGVQVWELHRTVNYHGHSA